MKLAVSIVYVAFIGILCFFIGESLPRDRFDENSFPYKIYKFEQNGKIYDKLQIKKWKCKVPDMSKIMKDMLPKSVFYNSTSEDLAKLIKETCVAEFIHLLLCFLSIGVYFIWCDGIGVLLCGITVLGNIPFILIQRYNRPHLIRIKNRLLKKELKAKSAHTDFIG